MILHLLSSKYFEITFGTYSNQYFVGLLFMFNKHSKLNAVRHLDIVLELFKFYIEIRIGKETK